MPRIGSVGLGEKLAVGVLPDAGLGPFALAERLANNDAGHQALLERLALLDVELVVMEATDGYESPSTTTRVRNRSR